MVILGFLICIFLLQEARVYFLVIMAGFSEVHPALLEESPVWLKGKSMKKHMYA